MANLNETAQWHDGIYQLAVTDKAKGGADGIANRQASQLADRTQYLKQNIDGGGGAAALLNRLAL